MPTRLESALFEMAARDPDIQDMETFVEYLGKSGEKLKASKQMFVDGPARKRPGFSPKISTNVEKLRNRPSEGKLFEVSPADTITFSTYRRMGYEPVVQFNMLLLKGWISGLKFSVESTDEEVKALVQYSLNNIYSQVVKDLLGAIQYGYTFGEKVWQPEALNLQKQGDDGNPESVFSGNVVTIKRVKFINPDASMRYYKNKSDQIDHVVQQQAGGETKVKREKLVWFALDEEFSGVFGRSRFKSFYKDWYYYQLTNQQLLRHLSKTGSPPLEARYPDGSTRLSEADKDYLGTDDEEWPNVLIAEELAATLLTQGAIVLPSTIDKDSGQFLWSLKFSENTNSSTDPFITVLKMLSNRMSEGIGIPANMGQGDSNLAESTANSELLIVILEDLVEQIERVIKSDIVDQLVEYNFGPEAIQNVSFNIDKTGLGRRKYLKEIYNNVIRLALSKENHVPVTMPDFVEIGRELGLKQRPFGDMFHERESPNQGENPETQKRQDEDSNNPERNRATKPTQNRPKASAKDSKEATGG